MKILTTVLILITFSNCTLVSYYKHSKAIQKEKLLQQSFKTEIPFREEKGLLVVEVKIENKVHNFIFDTGASTVLDENFAKTIKSKKIGTQKHTDSGGKKAMLKIRQLEKLSVGNIDFSSIIISVYDLSALKKATCIDFVGILGANVMNKAVWQIDYKRKVITLTDSRDSLLQKDNQKTFNFYSEGKGTPKIRVSVNDDYLDEAELDTGSSGGLELTKQKLSHFTTSKFISLYGSIFSLFSNKLDTTQITVLPIIKLGRDFEVPNTLVSFSSGLSRPLLIGNAFLKDYLVTIDWKRREITLSPAQSNVENQNNTYGFSPKLKDGKIIIGSIYENLAADKAGFKLNDEIVQINEVDFRHASYNDYCQLIQNWKDRKDKEISITVRQGNMEIKRILTQSNIKELILNSQN